MVSEQLTDFQLAIRKELLIDVHHLRSSESYKEDIRNPLPPRLSEELETPLQGDGVSQRAREPAGQSI